MRRAMVAVGLILAASAAGADEVYLRSGGRLSGNVVSENATTLEIEVGAGVVTVPRAIVQRIERGSSPLSTYQTRARALSPLDAAGWLELAEFARTAGLSGQARDAYRRVLSIDPNDGVARRALGYTRVGDQWLTQDEAMQSQGYVLFEGDWVTPIQRDSVLAERESLRRERAEAERSRAAVAEAEARAREAEARARAAEAEARRAEERHAFVTGPYGPWGWGEGPVSGPVIVTGGCRHNFHPHGRCTDSYVRSRTDSRSNWGSPSPVWGSGPNWGQSNVWGSSSDSRSRSTSSSRSSGISIELRGGSASRDASDDRDTDRDSAPSKSRAVRR